MQGSQGVTGVTDVLRQAERGGRNTERERGDKLHIGPAFMLQDMINQKKAQLYQDGSIGRQGDKGWYGDLWEPWTLAAPFD